MIKLKNSVHDGKSLIYTLKERVPKRKPCRTPVSISNILEVKYQNLLLASVWCGCDCSCVYIFFFYFHNYMLCLFWFTFLTNRQGYLFQIKQLLSMIQLNSNIQNNDNDNDILQHDWIIDYLGLQ